jgi:hypothetical protein
MAKKHPSKLRKAVEHSYTLSDKLQVQLQVLEQMRGQVRVQIKPAAADIEAVAFLVLMQAASSAQDDLKAIMAEVKAINGAKQKHRELLQSLQKSVQANAGHPAYDFDGIFMLLATLYAKQLEAEAIELLHKPDSLSELSEIESLRLQMVMDRLSKLMSTLSNLLKKASDTTSQIVQNLK